MNNNKIKHGQFFTVENVFKLNMYREWTTMFRIDKTLVYLEPFAGSNNLVRMMKEIGFDNKWKCYDIDPKYYTPKNGYYILKRDTIKHFPKGYRICITNPPYLNRSIATHKGIKIPEHKLNDLYKISLEKILDNCDYVAAIIPENFIRSGLFHNRLHSVSILNCKVFNDTTYPVCLALFIPERLKCGEEDFLVYKLDEYIGTYKQIQEKELKSDFNEIEWKKDIKKGNIGIYTLDTTNNNRIRFLRAEDLNIKKDYNTRTKIRMNGLPDEIDRDIFINKCNEILEQYREDTSDLLLTSFKHTLSNYEPAKTLNISQIKTIMNKAMEELNKKNNKKGV